MRERRNRSNENFILMNLNHKINRRAYLIRLYNEQYELYLEEDNWMIQDNHIENMNLLVDLLRELLYAKVGDELTKYICLK